MRLCAITDRKGMVREAVPEALLEQRLRAQVIAWITGGVELIQLREKDLGAPALRRLAETILAGVDRGPSKLLLNQPAQPDALREAVAIADGIHIPGPPRRGAADIVRETFAAAGRKAVISLSCHTLDEIAAACAERPDLLLFAPVFEKVATSGRPLPGVPASGLELLRLACRVASGIPVFALGGVTRVNAAACIAAGAAGVAGIRLFASGDWHSLGDPMRSNR